MFDFGSRYVRGTVVTTMSKRNHVASVAIINNTRGGIGTENISCKRERANGGKIKVPDDKLRMLPPCFHCVWNYTCINVVYIAGISLRSIIFQRFFSFLLFTCNYCPPLARFPISPARFPMVASAKKSSRKFNIAQWLTGHIGCGFIKNCNLEPEPAILQWKASEALG